VTTNVTQCRAPAATAPLRRSLLESGFPFAQVSELARRDRYCNDYVYSVHKWWARRPPAVIRALLLASVLGPETSEQEFWQAFADDRRSLEGLLVADPFMGGATTLVEASRLGADVAGIDVDPLAVRVTRVELQRLDSAAFTTESEALLIYLRERHGGLYPGSDKANPLHYFWLREADCGACGERSLIYRNLWLVRDCEKPGAVVREEGGVAFCPECIALHRLDANRKQIECCGHRHKIDRGTYRRARFECPNCRTCTRNDELKVGQLPSHLIAVEETLPGERRRLRKPTAADLSVVTGSCQGSPDPRALIEVSLKGVDSGRPAAYGFETVADLFNARQRLVFSDAFAWIRARDTAAPTKDALLLAVSNALGSNNLLCGYATDYGRLSALFSSVRAYSLPVLSVELNPLHESAGRGTLAATLRRVRHSGGARVKRHAIDSASGEVVAHSFPAHGASRRVVRCSSADRKLPTDLGAYDVVLTDPPYFDFIPYSDLSLLFRAWLGMESEAEQLGGTPIYPVGEDPATEFAERLARAFTNVRQALKPAAPMIFTFHSPHQAAWTALERALRDGGFRVHAVFPVWADGRSGSHGHAGNCEWDLVFVCRPKSTRGAPIRETLNGWREQLSGEELQDSDLRNLALGLAFAKRMSA